MELIQELSELVAQLGWVIGMPDGDEQVPGLIIGKQDFVEEVVTAYYGPGFEVYTKDEQGEIVTTEPKKKDTVH